MDADVEMTSLSQYDDSDEDAALTAELDMTLPSDHPPYRKKQRSRRCSLCSCLSSILLIVVFVVAMMHVRHDDRAVVEGTTSSSMSTKNNNDQTSTGTADGYQGNNENNNGNDISPQGHDTQNDIKKPNIPKPPTSAPGTEHETSPPPDEKTLVPPEPSSPAASIHNDEPDDTTEPTMNNDSSSSGDQQQKDDQIIADWLHANVTLQNGIKYQVVGQIEHDPTAFTEGLAYANGLLYESTGLNKQSSIRTLDPTTGKVIHSYPLDAKYFGEGLTYVNGKLYQLTYKKKTGFIFDASDLSKKPETFSFQTTTGEGWGMTYDSNTNELIVSDGSAFLHYWDATTTKPLRKVLVVRQKNKITRYINELEWWRGRVLANVWFEDTILVIHPETGVVEKEYDFSSLWPKKTRRAAGAEVLNGISVSEDPNVLYITGKNWNRTYLVKLLH